MPDNWIDELEATVGSLDEYPWFSSPMAKGDKYCWLNRADGNPIAGTSGRMIPATAEGIIALRNNAARLIALARFGLETLEQAELQMPNVDPRIKYTEVQVSRSEIAELRKALTTQRAGD